MKRRNRKIERSRRNAVANFVKAFLVNYDASVVLTRILPIVRL